MSVSEIPKALIFRAAGAAGGARTVYGRAASDMAVTARSEDIHPPHALISQQNSASFSPPASSMPTIPHPALGYTARRCGEAGSARGVRERRETSCTGPAENGLPPATRGKRRDIGPILPFQPRTARRACLCGTQGGGTGGCVGIVRRDGNRPGGGNTFRRIAKVCATDVKRPCPARKPVVNIHQSRLCRETGVAGKNRRTGRRKVSPNSFHSRQLPARRPTSFDTRCARTRVRHRMP
jgi:hypothetical protein